MARDRSKEKEFVRLCYHESGHAAANLDEGFTVRSLWVNAKPMGGGCEVHYTRKPTECDLSFAMRKITALLAGSAAEDPAGSGSKAVKSGPGTDIAEARTIALETTGDKVAAERLLAQCRTLAEQKVRELRPQVDAIARALLIRSGYLQDARLSGEEAEALFQRGRVSVQHSTPSREHFICFVPKSMPQAERQRLRQQHLDQHYGEQAANRRYVRRLIEMGKRIERQRQGH